MMTDIIYVAILILIMILTFIGDIKFIKYLDHTQKKVTKRIKRLTNRQKPENKSIGIPFDDIQVK